MDMSFDQRWERCLSCAVRTAAALGWRLEEQSATSVAESCNPLTRNRCAKESARLAELATPQE